MVSSYGDIGPDPFALVVDPCGFLAICSDGRPAAPSLGLRPGLTIRLSRERATPG
ncbi:MAG: hypothetical protein M0Z30_21940 [Actinomycetota bacterium]|nr:hypothetical protein [Actinomycetota bacterium]